MIRIIITAAAYVAIAATRSRLAPLASRLIPTTRASA
jgi:hypothetical protein